MTPELTNTCFELLGSSLALRNVQLARRTRPQGVSYAMAAFGALWAANCVAYYLSHGEQLAAGCAALRSCCAVVWCVYAFSPRKS